MSDVQKDDQILIFRVGPVICSVPAGEVDSIVPPQSLHKLPKQADFISGIFEYRKKPVSVVNLFHKFNYPEPTDNDEHRYVMGITEGGVIGFWVDEVLEITKQYDEHRANPPRFSNEDVFTETYLWRDKIILHTNFNRLFAMPDFAPLHAWVENGMTDAIAMNYPESDIEESDIVAWSEPEDSESSFLLDALMVRGVELSPDGDPNRELNAESEFDEMQDVSTMSEAPAESLVLDQSQTMIDEPCHENIDSTESEILDEPQSVIQSMIEKDLNVSNETDSAFESDVVDQSVLIESVNINSEALNSKLASDDEFEKVSVSAIAHDLESISEAKSVISDVETLGSSVINPDSAPVTEVETIGISDPDDEFEKVSVSGIAHDLESASEAKSVIADVETLGSSVINQDSVPVTEVESMGISNPEDEFEKVSVSAIAHDLESVSEARSVFETDAVDAVEPSNPSVINLDSVPVTEVESIDASEPEDELEKVSVSAIAHDLESVSEEKSVFETDAVDTVKPPNPSVINPDVAPVTEVESMGTPEQGDEFEKVGVSAIAHDLESVSEARSVFETEAVDTVESLNPSVINPDVASVTEVESMVTPEQGDEFERVEVSAIAHDAEVVSRLESESTSQDSDVLEESSQSNISNNLEIVDETQSELETKAAEVSEQGSISTISSELGVSSETELTQQFSVTEELTENSHVEISNNLEIISETQSIHESEVEYKTEEIIQSELAPVAESNIKTAVATPADSETNADSTSGDPANPVQQFSQFYGSESELTISPLTDLNQSTFMSSILHESVHQAGENSQNSEQSAQSVNELTESVDKKSELTSPQAHVNDAEAAEDNKNRKPTESRSASHRLPQPIIDRNTIEELALQHGDFSHNSNRRDNIVLQKPTASDVSYTIDIQESHPEYQEPKNKRMTEYEEKTEAHSNSVKSTEAKSLGSETIINQDFVETKINSDLLKDSDTLISEDLSAPVRVANGEQQAVRTSASVIHRQAQSTSIAANENVKYANVINEAGYSKYSREFSDEDSRQYQFAFDNPGQLSFEFGEIDKKLVRQEAVNDEKSDNDETDLLTKKQVDSQVEEDTVIADSKFRKFKDDVEAFFELNIKDKVNQYNNSQDSEQLVQPEKVATDHESVESILNESGIDEEIELESVVANSMADSGLHSLEMDDESRPQSVFEDSEEVTTQALMARRDEAVVKVIQRIDKQQESTKKTNPARLAFSILAASIIVFGVQHFWLNETSEPQLNVPRLQLLNEETELIVKKSEMHIETVKDKFGEEKTVRYVIRETKLPAPVVQEISTNAIGDVPDINAIATEALPVMFEWRQHTVAKGDTLWHLSISFFKDPFRYPDLAKWSNIKDPNKIYPGNIVKYTLGDPENPPL